MDKVPKIIVSIIIALGLFLAGWFAHAWKNREEVPRQVKKAISVLNENHKKALKALKDDYEEQLKKKNEIIADLQQIIERLLKLFETIPGSAASKVVDNLVTNREKLNNL